MATAPRIQNACHAEWMRIELAEPQSIRPVGQEKPLLVNHCSMQRARDDAPTEGGLKQNWKQRQQVS